MYVITHVLIFVFLLFINYQAFRMWQYEEAPKKDDVELEIKDTTNE